MTFEKFWEAIAARNDWRPGEVKVTSSSLKALAEQAYKKGYEEAKAERSLNDNLYGFAGF